MYESFYGFKEKPFNLTPNPAYLYMSRTHGNTYAHLKYGIMENKGFGVITGEIGSGKTTLINFLFRKMGQGIQVGIIHVTNVLPKTFLRMICKEFELEVDGMKGVEMLETFHQFLLNQFARKKRVILIIDEAQNLPLKTIEAIRMLSNLESERHHLLQIILIGQPELKTKLRRKELRQFAQRVTVYCHLSGLSQEEVKAYIHHRLRVAGTENVDIFNKEAIEAVYKYSRGIPRIINILCDTALVYGFADGRKTIERKVILKVVAGKKEGGVFLSTVDDKETVPQPDPVKAKTLAQLTERFQSIEQKIELFEKNVSTLEVRLNDWTNHQSKKDHIVFELLKLLRQSLEGRKQLILKCTKLKKQLEIERTKDSRVVALVK